MTTNEEAFRTAVFPSTDAPQAIPRSALPETPVLVVSHLTVGAEDPARPPLLTDLTLSIGAGEIMGLVGESGAGKSMAGAALSGLLPKGIVRRAGAAAEGSTASRSAKCGPCAAAGSDSSFRTRSRAWIP